jgi:hypothetical protein
MVFALTALAGCGGHGGGSAPPAGYLVGGGVTGLAGTGLVLVNNGGDDLAVTSTGGFRFATPVPAGSAYNVTVRSQPSAPTQVCSVTNGSGTITAGVLNIVVDCVTSSFAVGGTVTDLTGTGLVLRDNGGDDLAINADGTFAFATPVPSGQPYAVTVATQPAGQTTPCTVLGGSGTIGATDVTHVAVACGPYQLKLIAGQLGGYGNLDAHGDGARFDVLGGTAVDAAGDVYVADYGNDTIRRISAAGDVTTFAGTPGVRGSADGMGADARFRDPADVAVDSNGNVYVADGSNHTIRKITPAGAVSTLAGLAGAAGGLDGTGADARFASPCGVVADDAGNVYVADNQDHTIRVVSPSGVVTTLAGAHGTRGSTDGTGSAALFDSPCSVAVDSGGNAYVADTGNSTIRKITPTGVVTTLAGTADQSGSADGTGAAARFSAPFGIAADSAGNLYVSDTYNHTIRLVTAAGDVTTLAGAAGVAGTADGTGADARFSSPVGLRVASNGDVLVADGQNYTVRRITPAGVVTTLAGAAPAPGSADGAGAAASFNTPQSVVSDALGNLFVTDTYNYTIRQISPTGDVTTLAGTAGATGVADGAGADARFTLPNVIGIDAVGNLFVGDGCMLRKVTPAGVVTTVAGSPTLCAYADGTGAAARFVPFGGIAVDPAGNVYVSEPASDTLRKITPAGVVTTLAGAAGLAGSTDGTGSAARFYYPTHLAIDAAGNLIVADTRNSLVRKVTQAGVVTTIAGAAMQPGTADGTGSNARFGYLSGVAIDAAGNIYVHDSTTIRRIDNAANVVTVAGVPGVAGVLVGALPGGLNGPGGLAIIPDQGTHLAVVDLLENSVLEADVP